MGIQSQRRAKQRSRVVVEMDRGICPSSGPMRRCSARLGCNADELTRNADEKQMQGNIPSSTGNPMRHVALKPDCIIRKKKTWSSDVLWRGPVIACEGLGP